MTYKCLTKNIFTQDEYCVTPYREQDKYKIKDWRNQQMDVLRQKRLLTDEDQENYFTNFVSPSFIQPQPRIILFSYLFKDECIGYGGLTNVDWEDKRVELSFLLHPQRVKDEAVYEKDFSAFISLMKQAAFEEMDFNRIFTETYDIRPHHIAILEKNGFVLEGRMKQHIFINKQFTDSLIHGYLKNYYYA